MERSQNLQLYLPSEDDFYNIENFNENARILDTKIKELEGKVASGASDTIETVNEKLEEVKQLKTQIESSVESKLAAEAEKRFKDLYGLANKSVVISSDRSMISSTIGNVSVMTMMNKHGGSTNITTQVTKGDESYTKTTIIKKRENGEKQITVTYEKN